MSRHISFQKNTQESTTLPTEKKTTDVETANHTKPYNNNNEVFSLDGSTGSKIHEPYSTLEHPPLTISKSNLQKTQVEGNTSILLNGIHEENGNKYFIKNMPNEQEAAGEALVPYLSKYFGISHMVPKTKIHDEKHKGLLMVQDYLKDHITHVAPFLPGGEDARMKREQGIKKSANNGDLARAAVMNYFFTNIDRHRGNYQVHPEEGVKLFDHGYAFINGVDSHHIEPDYLSENSITNDKIPIDLVDYIDNLPVNQMDEHLKPLKFRGHIAFDYDFKTRKKMLLDAINKHGNVKTYQDLLDAMSK